MNTRFEAEALIRAAASGAIPAPGEVLLRTENGWIFSKVTVADFEGEIDPDQISSLPFTKITGVIANSQVPLGPVKQHEGDLDISFNQMTDQILAGQVPKDVVFQHLDELLDWIDFLISKAVSTRPESPAEKLYMAENYG